MWLPDGPFPPTQDGRTALMVAAVNNHCGAVELLLRGGSDVNLQNKVRDGLRCCGKERLCGGGGGEVIGHSGVLVCVRVVVTC